MGSYATRVATETFMDVAGSRRDFDLSDLEGSGSRTRPNLRSTPASPRPG